MKVEHIEYNHKGKIFEAHVGIPDPCPQKLPLVCVFHAWAGRDEFACNKAEMLAELGYIGCALDVYGKGVLGKNLEENGALMKELIDNRRELKGRILAGFEAIKSHPLVDTTRMGGIGFCFGGLCVLDLARSGAPVKGVVSFHGLLHAPSEIDREKIQAKVLVLHGNDDIMVPPEEVMAFQKEMTEAGVDWQLHTYGNTSHGFTNPKANNPSVGALYSPVAEKRSQKAMEFFFRETL